MRYLGDSGFSHDRGEAVGVLLTNLGTPDDPSPGAVRRFLAEFLSDPRVIEAPRWRWWPILHGVILRIRPRPSAAAYRAVWSEQGSPLLAISRRQAEALSRRLAGAFPAPLRVALGMRYGRPGLTDALEELRGAGCDRLLVLPLYPQYSATTTASTFDAASAALSRWRWLPELRFVSHYHDDPGYVAALAASVREAWTRDGAPDRLLLSFHGIPERYFRAGDPYYCHCQKTARLLRERLGDRLGPERVPMTVAFQSRVGREAWLRPYTDEVLREWGREGAGRVDVLCPGFAADCLETLEEIAIRNREDFVAAGGGELRYLPALNDRRDHVDALADLVLERTADWRRDGAADDGALGERKRRARALGASR